MLFRSSIQLFRSSIQLFRSSIQLFRSSTLACPPSTPGYSSVRHCLYGSGGEGILSRTLNVVIVVQIRRHDLGGACGSVVFLLSLLLLFDDLLQLLLAVLVVLEVAHPDISGPDCFRWRRNA
ncbi:hypothetical protein BV898_09996 [Hypsibius exemplaris]|uniref:Uncharacterized protein n=1 Tax=Hypsibius exemplaris TaxID=2072580 RepID=A0A1W0WL13_HYPEX|nr:hypothetical protein BV898_09996 [Hypsibius exemplaris]